MIDRNDEMVILDVLPEESFLKRHLPGAINIPFHQENFEVMVKKMITDKSVPVVIYCTDLECEASSKATEKLMEMGYKHVGDYELGIDDWMAQGYDLDE